MFFALMIESKSNRMEIAIECLSCNEVVRCRSGVLLNAVSNDFVICIFENKPNSNCKGQWQPLTARLVGGQASALVERGGVVMASKQKNDYFDLRREKAMISFRNF